MTEKVALVLKTDGVIPIQVMEYAQHLLNILVGVNHGKISEAVVVDNTEYERFHNHRSSHNGMCYVLHVQYPNLEYEYERLPTFIEKREERRKMITEFLKVDRISVVGSSEEPMNRFFIGLDGYKQFQQEKNITGIKSELSELRQLLEIMWFHPDMPGGKEQVKKAKRSYGFPEEEEEMEQQQELGFLKNKIGQLESTVSKLESEVHELKRKVDAKDGLDMLKNQQQKPLVFSGKNNVKNVPGFISGGKK